MKSKLSQHAFSSVAFATGCMLCGAGYVYKQIQEVKKKLQHVVPSCVEDRRPVFIYPAEGSHSGDLGTTRPEHIITMKRKMWFPGRGAHHLGIFAILKLAQSDDPRSHRLAIKAMANVHHWPWTDAEYRMIAQAIDHRTLIALAHSAKADRRFFLTPPPTPPCDKGLTQQLIDLLDVLPSADVDSCTAYFFDIAKKELERKDKSEEEIVVWNLEGNEFLEAYQVKKSKLQNKMQCLQSLLGHSKSPSHCKLIVKEGGLVCLRRVLEMEGEQKQITHTVSKILANLTYVEELHKDIVEAGLVTIFAEWMRGDDLALVLQATKALTNLDKDCDNLGRFCDGIHLYHPQFRTSSAVNADIVFVHGLLGGPVWTWRQGEPVQKAADDKAQEINRTNKSDSTNGSQESSNKEGLITPQTEVLPVKCWPKEWLAKDCANIRIVTVEFDTKLSDWAPQCPYDNEKRTLAVRSIELLEKLRSAGIGDRPVVWVGHSMGGLLIKKMLLLAQGKADLQKLVKLSKGIVFFSVPNRGSNLAKLSNRTKYLLYPSVEVKELALNSPQLIQLHEHFTDLLSQADIPVLSFGEGQPIQLPLGFKSILVPEESSEPGYGRFYKMHELNHMDICKPLSRSSPVYRLTLEFIRDALNIKKSVQNEDLIDELALRSA